MESRYLAGIFPKRHRPIPRPWTDWVRLGVVVILVVGAVGAFAARDPLRRLATCNDGWPNTAAWAAGDQCVGLSEGPYAFGLPAFEHVMRVVDEQNRTAADGCPGTPVTVGVLLTMTDHLAGSRAVHELEGMAVGQRRANGTGCVHPLRLVVGNLGDYGRRGDALAVARKLAQRGDVVAVAGIGLSDQTTAEVADLLAAEKIPMVSDLVTAEGFDQSGSAGDDPDFARCDEDITYPGGVGKDYFYRVAFRVAVQVRALGAVAPTRPDFVMVPTGGSDPYTCTTLPLLHRQYGGELLEVKFDAEEPTTVSQTARRVCATAADVTIAYLARGRDLGRLLYSLDESYTNGQCAATSITVLSTSDGNRLRTAESDAALEDLRGKALRSPSFSSGRVRLLFTRVAGADGPDQGNPQWGAFEEAYAAAGFDLAHIGDGWAVNAYDALSTVVAAVRALPAASTVQRSQVNITIGGFTSPDLAVNGAGGPIVFDNSGNRAGPGPAVVRLCPAGEAGGRPYVPTVEAKPGEPIPNCARSTA
ncbi:ABC-type branched-chain amino acid transport system, substrate-binding protein [Nocardia amikacinitolerans]|nr:ABC-type branched-chain amino acid transport system, substrate-binding protein [Nocardia amikacinitolerans]